MEKHKINQILCNLGFDITRPYHQSKMIVGDNDKFKRIWVLDPNVKKYFETKKPVEIWNKYLNRHVSLYYNIDAKRFFRSINCESINRVHTNFKHVVEKNVAVELNKKEKNLSLYRKKNSRILAFDIDQHNNNDNAKEIVKKLLKMFGKKSLILLEKSVINGGYHFYIQLNQPINDNQIKQLQKQLQNELIAENIEIKKSTELIAIPGSFGYRILYPSNWLNSLAQKDRLQQDTNIPIILNGDAPLPLSISTFFRERSDQMIGRFPMTRNNRINNYLKVIRYCVYNNISISQCVKIIKQNNYGSKDLESWSNDKLYSDVANAYLEWNKIANRKRLDTKFQSNLIDNHIIIEETTEKLLRLLSHKYDSWRQESRRAINIILREMFGYILYQDKYPRKIDEKLSITFEKRKHLETGYTFDRLWLRKLKNHYHLRCDCMKILNLILYQSKLFKQFKHNTRGYICLDFIKISRQFILKNRYKINTYYSILKYICDNTILNYYVKSFIKEIKRKEPIFEQKVVFTTDCMRN